MANEYSWSGGNKYPWSGHEGDLVGYDNYMSVYLSDGQYYVLGAKWPEPEKISKEQAGEWQDTRKGWTGVQNIDLGEDAADSSSSSSSSSSNVLNMAYDAWKNYPGKDSIDKYLSWFYPYIRKLQEQGYPEVPFDLQIAAPEGEKELIDQAMQMAQEGMYGPGGVDALINKAKQDYEEGTKKPMEERLNQMGITGSAGTELMGRIGAAYETDLMAKRAELTGADYAAKGAAIGQTFNMLARPEERARRNLELKYQDWATRSMFPVQTAGTLGVPVASMAEGTRSSVYNTGMQVGGGIAQAQIGASAQLAATQMGINQARWEWAQQKPFVALASNPIEPPSSGCCWIFMEARYSTGALDRVVRRFRDENMTQRNKRGYYRLSQVLVPLMRRSRLVKLLVRVCLTDPLFSYGKYHYGEGRIGWLFAPVKSFWLRLFDLLGQDHPFLRENGELI